MSPTQKLHLLREMIRIRRVEQQCINRYINGTMGGFLVSSIGQESTPVAVRSIMGPNDHTITGVRGIGAAIAAGISPASIIAELMGKTGGCNQGKGGNFSLFSPAHRHWGCYPIAAAQTPIALGLSFALKYQQTEGVVFCFLGDGAINQGVFHETLNLAGLFDIPTIFVLENNKYAMGTSNRRSSAFKDHLARRAEAYDIDWDLANGWEIDALLTKLTEARERALQKGRPTVLEVATYRYYGFTIADANQKKYRTPEEINFHKEHRDPIRHWVDQLTPEGLLTPGIEKEMHETAKAEALAASDFAENSPHPTPADLLDHVYWESDNKTPASEQGRYFFNDESPLPPQKS
jgi:pyruvate dehydrogenase E1 component alpha subunit